VDGACDLCAGIGALLPRMRSAAGRPKEATSHTLKHLVVMPVRVTWHKSIFWCDNSGCEKASFAEAGPLARAGGWVTEHAKKALHSGRRHQPQSSEKDQVKASRQNP
jgi:hypothetical protein